MTAALPQAASNPSPSKGFRLDINGLRAWAVAAVILYHFGIPGLEGGFVGVDVFFVISGFLMTGIIVQGLERDRFSLVAFYLARAKRIAPALLVLCAALLTLGWFTLPSLDYRTLATQAVFSSLFLSNIKFWTEAGYFDAASHEKWLLHTWSLSVEWQFYLVLPLLMMAAWRWRPSRTWLTAVLAAAFAGSLILSVVISPTAPSASFYLLPTRAWEMLAGGLAFLLGNRYAAVERPRLEIAGFALVIGSVLLANVGDPWPGWKALLPVSGSVLILLSARTNSVFTANPVAQWAGTCSYSLYLWHWPVVVALVFLEQQHNQLAIGAGLLLTLALGHFSYRWVEAPLRSSLGRLKPSAVMAWFVGGSLALVLAGVIIRVQGGLPHRLSPSVELAAQEALNKKPRQLECLARDEPRSPSCLFGTGSQVRAVLIGDSHADAVTTAVAAALPGTTSGAVLDWSYVGCPTLLGAQHRNGLFSKKPRCAEFNAWALQEVNRLPPDVPLIMVSRTSHYAVGYNEPWEKAGRTPLVFFTQEYAASKPQFLKEFSNKLVETACTFARTRPVYLVRPLPEMGVDVPKSMSRRAAMGLPERPISVSLKAYHERHGVVWAAQDEARRRCNVTVLDPRPYLCPDGQCESSRSGRPLYVDDDHLSEYGNKLLVPMFRQIFENRG